MSPNTSSSMASELPGANSRQKLLVVDDQPVNIHALYRIFGADHDVFMAASGEEALAFCRATAPDLVLLDVVMPGMSGLEVCRALKSHPETSAIPVIFVTSLDDPKEEEACWDAGGVDFITKPVNAQTTRNRVRAHLTLKQQADTLRRMAWVDGLTGVANKRQLDELLGHEWKRCLRDHLYISLAIIDIDFFKAFNDTYGHLAGDDCLRSVAKAIDSCMSRPGDFVARTGGEEFTCVLPGANPQGAIIIASKIELAVRELSIFHAGGVLDFVTVSVGVATAHPQREEPIEQVMGRSDKALYRAKDQGRARFVSDDGDSTSLCGPARVL